MIPYGVIKKSNEIHNYLLNEIDNSLDIKLWIKDDTIKNPAKAAIICERLQKEISLLSLKLEMEFIHHTKNRNYKLIEILFNNNFKYYNISSNNPFNNNNNNNCYNGI